jgi:hypothetical protein
MVGASLAAQEETKHQIIMFIGYFTTKTDTPSFPLQELLANSQLAGLKKFFKVYSSKIFNNHY